MQRLLASRTVDNHCVSQQQQPHQQQRQSQPQQQKSRSIRKTKPTYTVNRKTLDMQHAEQVDMIDSLSNETMAIKKSMADASMRIAELTAADPAGKVLEIVRLKDVVSEGRVRLEQISSTCRADSINYFTDAGGILFRYYDIIDSVKSSNRSTSHESKKKQQNVVGVSSNSASILQYFGGVNNDKCVPSSSAAAARKNKKPQGDDVGGVEDFDDDDEEDDQRGTLLDKYMEITSNDHVKTAIINEQQFCCATCGGTDRTVMANDGYLLCKGCHTIEYLVVDHEKPSYKDPPKEISYYAYKRLNHFNEWLNQVQGKETTDIPEEVFDSILAEIKKQKIDNIARLTNASIRTILKRLKIHKFYEHIPHIINRLNGVPMPNMSPELEEKLRNMFKMIQAPFLKHSPMARKNFLSYSYVLHKFIQLLGHDEYLANFPLLKARDKLHQQDQIWSKICVELNWEFIKSL